MPIRGFIGDEARFDAMTVQSMSEALAGCLDALSLVDTHDGLTLIVAQKIVDLALAGETDPARLKTRVLSSIRQ